MIKATPGRPAADDDIDNPTWTQEELARAQGPETMPPEMLAAFPKTAARLRAPRKTPPKRRITIRLNPKVVEYYEATGKGWQTRMDEDLQALVKAKA